jgi:hypothetical protein
MNADGLLVNRKSIVAMAAHPSELVVPKKGFSNCFVDTGTGHWMQSLLMKLPPAFSTLPFSIPTLALVAMDTQW